MGKKREVSDDEEEIDIESPGKKHGHKKHKKHKHKVKKKKDDVEESDPTEQEVAEPGKPAIKLKLKIGGQTLSTKNVAKKEIHRKTPNPDEASHEATETDEKDQGIDKQVSPDKSKLKKTSKEASDVFKTKKSGDDTSDEEKEWLDALEKGTLDDSGAIKKSKDPTLLTARQRALIHGNKEDTLLELPTGYKTQELTEEQQQRRLQRAKKRREQAHEKREKDKKQTLDRLLKKQDSKLKGKKSRVKKHHAPGFRYSNNQTQITISVPQNFPSPFKKMEPLELPKPKMCQVKGCSNLKKYACSKTGKDLCSLECYRKNLGIKQTVSSIPVS